MVELAVERAEEIQRTFWEFKAEVPRSAQNSRTGKTIPPRLIAEIESTESARETELGKARLRNIQLMAHLRKLEARLKQKEELAEGLHLIDFEQLKIENDVSGLFEPGEGAYVRKGSDRDCTDKLCCAVFLIYWGGMCFLIWFAACVAG